MKAQITVDGDTGYVLDDGAAAEVMEALKPVEEYLGSPEFKVASLSIKNFKGIEIFFYKFSETGKLVACGDHGSAKTCILEAAKCLFYGQTAFSQIDDPVRQGQKKLEISAELEGTGQLNGFDIGSSLRVSVTKSRKGRPQYKIEDLENNAVIKKNQKDILDELRGMWVDPYEFLNMLYEKKDTRIGAKKQAQFVCESVGLDLSPFIERAKELALQYTIENDQVSRTEGVLKDTRIPQDDWPTERLDPEVIQKEIDRLNNHKRANENRKQVITNEQSTIVHKNNLIEATKETLGTAITVHTNQKLAHEAAQIKYVNQGKEIDLHKVNNPEKVWDGAQDIEGQIQVLLKEQKRKQEFDKEEQRKKDELSKLQNIAGLLKKDVDAEMGKLTEKQDNINIIREQINAGNRQLEELKQDLEKTKNENQPILWNGEKDPDGVLEPDEYLAKKMSSVKENNQYMDDRDTFERVTKENKLARQALDKVKQDQKANEAEKMLKIDGTDLKVRYLTVDENRLYVQLPGKPKVSLNDLNHEAQIGICTEIMMANSKSPLKLIVIREGYGCLPGSQRAIFDAAFRWGYNVILETFIWTDDDDCVYMENGHMIDAKEALTKISKNHNLSVMPIGGFLGFDPGSPEGDRTIINNEVTQTMDLG